MNSTQKTSHSSYEEIINLCKKSKVNELKLAAYLHYLKRYDVWRDAVGGLDRWEDFLKQPEIGISTHKANKLIRIYEFFAVKNPGYKIQNVPISVLDYIAKNNVSKDKISELLADGEVLSAADFKEKFHDTVNAEEGKEAARTYTYLIMKKCVETGTMVKVHDITSDDIKNKFNLE